MPVFNGAFPVLPGKEGEARKFASEIQGSRKAEYQAFQAASGGTTRETWSLQSTPAGSFMLVWFEAKDVAGAFEHLATGKEPFIAWFRSRIQDVTGLDMSLPSDEAQPDLLIDWKA